jgi:hypothetical protein
MSEPDRRVSAYNPNGEYAGFVRLSHDDIGELIGEVYDKDANKLGAVRVAPQITNTDISRVYEQDGRQIGYVQIDSSAAETISARIYWTGGDEEGEQIAYLGAQSPENPEFTVWKRSARGEELGVLKPEAIEDSSEIALLGGGAALLIFL